MRVSRSGNIVVLSREEGERPVPNEPALFHRLRRTLAGLGKDVVRREMAKDGHIVPWGVYYVRSRRIGRRGSFAIWDPRFGLRDAADEYNNAGEISLAVVDMSR